LLDTFFYRALEQRKDNQNTIRGIALTEIATGNYSGAEQILLQGLKINYNSNFGDVKRVLREELAYVYRTWSNKIPSDASTVLTKANTNQIDINYQDKLRVTLSWQTDANDVDLHIVDPYSEECYFAKRTVASGLNLYYDVTQGLVQKSL